jgi:hypothetical protein
MRARARLLRAGAAGAALLLAGCVAKSLSSEGAEVTMTSKPPRGCERLGDVTGRSGGWLTGDVTSQKDLDAGARNELRNAAAKLGADTVQIVRREGTTAQTFAGHGEPNQVHYSGVAWRCAHR